MCAVPSSASTVAAELVVVDAALRPELVPELPTFWAVCEDCESKYEAGEDVRKPVAVFG
jgi:hypothetical protein